MSLIKLKKLKKVDRQNLVYRTNKFTYSFKSFWSINALGRDNYNSTITLKEADKGQSDLLLKIRIF